MRPRLHRHVRGAHRRPQRLLPAVLLVLPAGLLGSAALNGLPTGTTLASATASPAPPAPAQVPAGGRPPADRSMAVAPAPARTAHHASRSEHRPPLHQWVRPADGPISSPFGERWGRMHEGVDIAAPYGAPIRAATDGVVIYAGPAAGYGRVLLIRDYDGDVSAYGHMSAFVKTAGPVHAGEVIARVGAAGDATGPHLHFEIRKGGRDGAKVNPVPVLAAHGVTIG